MVFTFEEEMKEYKCAYAGLPELAKKVTANSPKEAARKFFYDQKATNHIFVNVSIFKEENYSWKDFLDTDPNLKEDDIPHFVQKEEQPTKPPGLLAQFMNHLIKGEFATWDWKDKK